MKGKKKSGTGVLKILTPSALQRAYAGVIGTRNGLFRRNVHGMSHLFTFELFLLHL
jgi:hypothetical protein